MKTIFISASIIFICILQVTSAAVIHSPELNWKSLHTPHFVIHYHEGEENISQTVAHTAEIVHLRLTPFFQWQPTEKTDIVLTDRAIFPSGFASTRPANRIKLHLKAFSALSEQTDTLAYLIAHEYAHILHLDKNSGVPAFLRRIFGRNSFLFPNRMQPAWLIEGIASYAGDFINSNNNVSLTMQTLMRLEVENGVKPIWQINQAIKSLPAGTTPYLYGEYFYKFIDETYGKEKIQALINNYSDNFFPFFVNSNAKDVFGISMSELWLQFEQYLRDQFEPQLNDIKQRGIRLGDAVTYNSSSNYLITAHPDGNLYFVNSDRKSIPRLMKLNNSNLSSLGSISNLRSMDIHPDSGLLISKSEWENNTLHSWDLYVRDLVTQEETRITRNQRYINAVWSPDGKQIAALRYIAAGYSLDLLDQHGNFRTQLWSNNTQIKLDGLDWAPNGKTILSSVKRGDSTWNIEEFDLNTKQWKSLSNTAYSEIQPRYTQDGKGIIFSAPYKGVYNIHYLDKASNTKHILSNVTGSAFGAVAQQSKIYYLNSHATGNKIFKLNFSKLINSSTKLPNNEIETSESLDSNVASSNDDSKFKITTYSPATGLTPTAWMPHLVLENDRSEFGFHTGGSDPLNRHQYKLSYSYDSKNDFSEGRATYENNQWSPVFRLSGNRNNKILRDNQSNINRIRRSDTIRLESIFPILKTNSRWTFHLSILSENISDSWTKAGTLPLNSINDNRLGLAVVHDSSKQYALSISRTDGRKVAFSFEDSDILHSDFIGELYSIDWREYFNLGNAHTLAWRLMWGRSTDESRQYNLGGQVRAVNNRIRPSSMAPIIPAASYEQTRFGLRGYNEGHPSLIGPRMFVSSLEWRFPITRIERGMMVPPMALDHLSGTVFVDYGDAWVNNDRDSHVGYGIELNVSAYLLYHMKSDIRFGYAIGNDAGGEEKTYIKFGTVF